MKDFRKMYEKIRRLYEKEYDIHFCRTDEIDRVVTFIDTYWQKGHIFTKSRELLDWQHYDKKNNRYNFVVAVHKSTHEIHALVGFIMSSIYDESIETPMRWGAIWKIREDVGAKGLGLVLKGFFEKYAYAPYVGGIGLSHYSKEINEKLGEEVGQLKLFYMLNAKMKKYSLVGNYENVSFPEAQPVRDSGFHMIGKKEFRENDKGYLKCIPPYKSRGYYVGRYFEHPIYQYYFTEILNGKKEAVACFVWRFCCAEGKRCIVIVDYMGTGAELSGHYDDFQQLLIEHEAEYISFFNLGIPEQYFKEAGFKDREDSNIIIPVYYEPFLKKNVTLDYHYYADEDGKDGKMIFKGDADQDRPNRIEVEM